MMTTEESLIFVGLSDEAIDAIARHERLPVMEAARVGEVLVKTSQGQRVIRLFMEENLRHASAAPLAAELKGSLQRFCAAHPECRE